LLLIPTVLRAQNDISERALLLSVMQRLDALEQQNRELIQEVRTLKQKLGGQDPPSAPATQQEVERLDERVTVNEHRVEEQAQTKVQAAQRLPVTLNGMLLFNAFWNGYASKQYPYIGGDPYLVGGPNTAGGTIRQTLLGLAFDGPEVLRGGKVTGFVSLDLAGGSSTSYGMFRLRRGAISLDWADRGFSVGQDKLLISPRNPSSLAEVSTPPLSSAGNLWLWVPQARYEERHQFSDNNGIRLQASLVETEENRASVPDPYKDSLEPSRPGIEGRVELWHKWGETNRVEFASGAHKSTTHVAGSSVPSYLYSFDGLVHPASWFELTGTFFSGQNLAALSGPPNSFRIDAAGAVHAVRGNGGWLQAAFPVTERLTLNAFGGWQKSSDYGLTGNVFDATRSFAGNFIYRLGPNVLVSAEAGQYRYYYTQSRPKLLNHYDLALGYSF
jgi:hypothetical protein